MARLFGTDGVRGVANLELTPELAYRLGRAATLYFGEGCDKPRILIARDTRVSGHMFEAALSAGICSAGGVAVNVGVVPTPAAAYLTKEKGMQAGIVISASHNPFADNGIKFFGADGFKLPDAVEDEIEALVRRIAGHDDLNRPTGSAIGTIKYRPEMRMEYINFVLSTTDVDLTGKTIVLDCANGAASTVMPEILAQLGASVIVMSADPDGVNINDGCGSTHLEQLQRAVVEEKAFMGIAHDGDADRCLCVDEKGEVMDGDHMLIICGLDMLRRGVLKGNTVVTTVMANIGFHQALKQAGARAEITNVGDRYVLENMRANGYNLGGEQSGHIIFGDFTTTGDGPVTALQVVSAIVRSGKKASEMNALMTSYPQLLVNVRVRSKEGWAENTAIAAAIAEGNKELGDTGRILVRPSGTEPLIRVMAEGSDQKQLDEVCNRIADIIRKEIGE